MFSIKKLFGAPAAAPKTTPQASSVKADAPEPPPIEEKREPHQFDAEEITEMCSDESLRELVEGCPKECLAQLYKAGDRIRHLVNERWHANR